MSRFSITPREREIMRVTNQGCRKRAYPRHLGIRVATAKSHAHHIRGVLGTTKRSESLRKPSDQRLTASSRPEPMTSGGSTAPPCSVLTANRPVEPP